MNTWFTSDQHFFHTNIIRLANRPFNSIEEMHEMLITNWQQVVQEDDLVYVCGDFSWRYDQIPQLLKRLPGRKVLIAGNHEKCFKELHGISTYRKYTDFYLKAGFEAIYTNLVIEIAGQPVNLSHFPYRSEQPNPEYDDRYREMRLVNDGRFLVHGHIHQRGLYRNKMINVSVEMHNYSPVSIDTIAKHIQDNPNGIENDNHSLNISSQNLTSLNNEPEESDPTL
jgi:calcineurin-like phosphoesterase family protein